MDTGWAGFNGRDADRVLAAAKAAGIDHLDYLVITHYHGDHAGGVPELAKRIKIGTFVDHGANTEQSDATRATYDAYETAIAGSKHILAKPGERLPLKGMSVRFVAAAGEAISSPLPGAGQANSACASEPAPPEDPTENAQSVGMLFTYGKFRFIDLGDLTKKKELRLVCPNNLIGTVDLYLVTHHGMDISNSNAMLHALHPRVAIMNNGARKGGIPAAWQIVHDSSGLEDLWQLHYAEAGGDSHNTSEKLIANTGQTDGGNYIKVSAEPGGSFTVTNTRNDYEKTYKK